MESMPTESLPAEAGTIPHTMRAVVHDRFGGPEVLSMSTEPTPSPGRGEVLVAVAATAMDRGVWHLVTGRPGIVRLGTGLRRPRRRIPGTDLAGVVAAVGPGVERLRVGDRVFGTSRGTFADYVVAEEARLAPVPTGLSFQQAAAVPVSAEAALVAVRDHAGVEPGQRVLVLGASGGVGTYAVQLVRHFGAEVTAVCSGSKAEAVRSLGVERVLDHRSVDPVDGSERYDAILDIGGVRPLHSLRRALTPTGTLVIVATNGSDGLTGGIGRMLRAALWSPFVRQRFRTLVAPERSEDLEWLTPLLASGTLRPVIDRILPIEQAGDALAALGAGEVTGKVVLDIGGAP